MSHCSLMDMHQKINHERSSCFFTTLNNYLQLSGAPSIQLLGHLSFFTHQEHPYNDVLSLIMSCVRRNSQSRHMRRSADAQGALVQLHLYALVRLAETLVILFSTCIYAQRILHSKSTVLAFRQRLSPE